MRYTTLKSADGARGLVPNANLFTTPIKVRGAPRPPQSPS